MSTRQGSESASGALMAASQMPLLDITSEQQRQAEACIRRMVADEDDRETIYAALFGRHRPVQSPTLPVAERPYRVDPARSHLPPDSITAWRAQVREWGHSNGWPGGYSKRPLDPELLAAYRAAHPKEAS